jgi:hypothetical protein
MEPFPPLCPNCIEPMRLTRSIQADALHRGQHVFECAACRVAMTLPEEDAKRRAQRLGQRVD